MKILRVALIASAIAAHTAAPAHAGGFNLSWNDCGSAGVASETFACNTNTGTHTLVVSFEPNAPIPNMTGVAATIEFVVTPVAVPPWWQTYVTGTCRQTAIAANGNFATKVACSDVWLGLAAGGAAADPIGMFGPSTARLHAAVAVPESVSVAPGTEYYAMNVVISNAKTVGTPSCAGCDVPGCIRLTRLQLATNTASTDLTTTLSRSIVTWQNGAASACVIVPTMSPTWGAIKTLYR